MAFTHFTTQVLGFLLSALAHDDPTSMVCDSTSMVQRALQQKGKEQHAQVDVSFANSSALPSGRSKTIVFYNLFVKHDHDIPRVSNLCRHQLSHLDPHHHQLWITSIGAVKDISELHLETLWSVDSMDSMPAHFRHLDEGNESLTLHELWSYCRRPEVSPSQVVVYIHSKGSYHAKPSTITCGNTLPWALSRKIAGICQAAAMFVP